MRTGNRRADALYTHIRGIQCVYCGERANTEDHLQPRSHVAKLLGIINLREALGRLVTVPACLECNSLVGAKIFLTTGAKRRYIQAKLRHRYRRVLEMPAWSNKELGEITCPNLRSIIVSGVEQKERLLHRVRWRNVKVAEEALSVKSIGKDSAPTNVALRFMQTRQPKRENPGEKETAAQKLIRTTPREILDDLALICSTPDDIVLELRRRAKLDRRACYQFIASSAQYF